MITEPSDSFYLKTRVLESNRDDEQTAFLDRDGQGSLLGSDAGLDPTILLYQKSNRTRARVEDIFGGIEHLWGDRKTRYRGLSKNAAQVYTLAALTNFYLARDSLLTTPTLG